MTIAFLAYLAGALATGILLGLLRWPLRWIASGVVTWPVTLIGLAGVISVALMDADDD